MKVYPLVLTDGYDAYSVKGVYSSLARAEAAQDPDAEDQVDYYVVLEFELDGAPE